MAPGSPIGPDERMRPVDGRVPAAQDAVLAVEDEPAEPDRVPFETSKPGSQGVRRGPVGPLGADGDDEGLRRRHRCRASTGSSRCPRPTTGSSGGRQPPRVDEVRVEILRRSGHVRDEPCDGVGIPFRRLERNGREERGDDDCKRQDAATNGSVIMSILPFSLAKTRSSPWLLRTSGGRQFGGTVRRSLRAVHADDLRRAIRDADKRTSSPPSFTCSRRGNQLFRRVADLWLLAPAAAEGKPWGGAALTAARPD